MGGVLDSGTSTYSMEQVCVRLNLPKECCCSGEGVRWLGQEVMWNNSADHAFKFTWDWVPGIRIIALLTSLISHETM